MSLATIFPQSVHMNWLLLLGVAIFGGTVGARIFKRIRVPQVVGYIVIGLVLGETGLGVLDADTVAALRPFNYFALGIIGFMIGGELKVEAFRRQGRQFLVILLAEGVGAFLVVGVLTTAVAWMATRDLRQSLALGLALGAISSATAPAATVDVLWEYRSGGPLTATVLAIVALDDGLALVLFGIAASAADALLGHSGEGVATAVLRPLVEIFGAALLGGIGGAGLAFLLRRIKEQDNSLTFALGAVFLVIGVTLVFDLDLILAAMVLGTTLANLAPRRSLNAFELVGKFAPPIYVLFFVLVGARMAFAQMAPWVWGLALAYVAGRTGGKMIGARWGAVWARAPETVRRYLGLCLFSQAGVAIGLSILASQRFTGPTEALGRTIVIVITTSTFLVQLLGPPCVRLGIQKAGEMHMNLTEEDLIATLTVSDVMDEKPVSIRNDAPVSSVLRTFSEHDSLCYPVTDKGGRLVGMISFQNIKDTLARSDLHALLLADDLAQPARDIITPDAPLPEVLERMRLTRADHLAVVADRERRDLVGFLDRQRIMRAVASEIIRRREKATGLDAAPA